MPKLTAAKYRLLIALRYLNASEALLAGMKTANDLHFLVTLRSFIEYTRRGIWFLAWAKDGQLAIAENLTFQKPGSPSLVKMDEMINNALGQGQVSHLLKKVPGVNEPFLDCLHALTHGNPISVRMFGIQLKKIYQFDKLFMRAEMELNMFRVLVYRRALGEDPKAIWKILAPIHNRPEDMKAIATSAAMEIKKAGGFDKLMQQFV